MIVEGPLDLGRNAVRPDWIDYNGHMNVAYYVLAFDQAFDRFLQQVGLDPAHRDTVGGSVFAVESHVTYQRELVEGDPIRLTLQLLDLDRKRFIAFLRMYHAEKGYLAATSEWLDLYVNLQTRRVAEMPEAVYARFAAVLETHRGLERPREARLSFARPLAASAKG